MKLRGTFARSTAHYGWKINILAQSIQYIEDSFLSAKRVPSTPYCYVLKNKISIFSSYYLTYKGFKTI